MFVNFEKVGLGEKLCSLVIFETASSMIYFQNQTFITDVDLLAQSCEVVNICQLFI